MKSDFHFHFYSRIVIMAVLAVSLILIQKSVTSNAEISSYPYPIGGWAWSSASGWLSLNCYNDFDTPGEYEDSCDNVVTQWPTNPDDYGLTVDSSGNVKGCTWSGNLLNNGGNPLGWICFSGQSAVGGPTANVATSTTHLNALASTTFASIIGQENWTCNAASDNSGDDCLEDADCPNGACEFYDDGAWQLGFPILSSADLDDDAPYIGPPGSTPPGNVKDIAGCFNCYEEWVASCEIQTDDHNDINCAVGDSLDQNICDTTEEGRCSGNQDRPCMFTVPDCNDGNYDFGTCIEIPVAHGACIQTDIDYSCENCLEYFYYPGRCADTPTISCRSIDDCPSGICEEISTCYYDIEYDCTDYSPGDCAGGADECISRPTGSLKKLIGAYNCSECSIANYDNTCGINTYQGNINSCNMCQETYYSPGVMLDHKHYNLDVGSFPTPPPDPDGERANLCGWGWNAYDEGGEIYGLGWFQFGPRVVTSTKPYLAVDGGSVYSRGDITGRYLPPFGHYNASYLIESGGSITNFVSSSTLSGIYQGEFPYRPMIDFFSLSDGKYSNALGSIDRYGLITDHENGNNINKYGSDIVVISGTTFNASTPTGGAIHRYQPSGGPLTVDSAITVPSGSDLIPNATGIIWVEGDLTINEDIEYELGSVENLIRIPSLVWIIEGDLKINWQVSKLAGTFIVLGDGNSCSFVSPEVPDPGCGQIITCEGTPGQCSMNSLTVSGNVMAKYFDLGRYFIDVSTGEPSENFINDGRLQANPPPGFEDFSNVIPRFSEN
ncbi:MAG: hypothetical protein HOE19_04615 [Candidatus Komeilibacteria bacterium]|jgi:hypothetical protein|nr:hypothetical protein [Candidatus Komeilibacteria bacterium]MBT4447954.1 hypothetical protein [Candidatus Komeilibacteria bacterium]